MNKEEAYKAWWHNEGSGITPLPNEDMEEFAHRITQIAWSNGAFKEREQILFAIKELRGRSQEPVSWMIWGKNNVPSLTFKKPSDKYVFDSLYTTPPQRKEPEQEPVSWMSEDEREAFERFNETCEDGEGYDVPKTMMRRLAEIGVIHHTSRGIYGITKFGRLLVGNTTPPQRKPLTDEQIEEIAEGYLVDYRIPAGCAWNFARDIEAAHNIKE